MGPASFPAGAGVDVPPHPHMGLQTVTWLFEGTAVHRDSLGSEQRIRPGQLNLMTAGAGIAHAEEDPGGPGGTLHGVQLWVAQPEATRWGPPAFEHHAELPRVSLDHGVATVLVGPALGATSPARCDTGHVGLELDLRRGCCVLPLDPTHEYAVVLAEGTAALDATVVGPGRLAYLAPGRDELAVTVDAPARALLLGGAPFDEPVAMWWNFVARSRDELTAAYRDWTSGDERFGVVASASARTEVGPPPWAARG